MRGHLEVTPQSEGWRLTLRADAAPVPFNRWALFEIQLPNGQKGSVQALLAISESDLAIMDGDEGVMISHAAISRLENRSLLSLGLPTRVPFRLKIEASGNLSSPSFRFNYQFCHGDGRSIVGAKRLGSLLRVASSNYIIPDPYYSIVSGMDSYNATPPDDMDRRFLEWGRLKALLPDESIIDNTLRAVNVVLADSYTVIPHADVAGQWTFDVAVTRSSATTRDTNEDDQPEAIEDASERLLPPAVEAEFNKQFMGLAEPRIRYGLPGGWFVVLSPELREALQPAQKALRLGPNHRFEFLSNPRAAIRRALDGKVSEEVMESLFVESSEFSKRVQGLGNWLKPVLPWIKANREPFLPPEKFGIRIGDQYIPISREDIPILIRDVSEAIADYKPIVKFGEEVLRADEKTLQVLTDLKEEIERFPANPTSDDQPTAYIVETTPATKKVLIVERSLENEPYRVQRERGRAALHSGVLPIGIISSGFTHQTDGIRWLQDRWNAGYRGALLADDMGLGKTWQALVFLAWLREAMTSGRISKQPILIIAPTGLLNNWLDEHNQHLLAPGLGEPTLAYGQNLRALRAMTHKECEIEAPVLDLNKLNRADWVLTTYETMRDYQKSFGLVRWAAIVFDEAQKIKNPAALMTDAAKALNADFAIALTGTPVENRLADLWCILDALEPGALDSLKAFSDKYENVEDEAIQQSRLEDLKKEITECNGPAIMLRRMKEDHLEGLPEKKMHVERVQMPFIQANAYDAAIQEARAGDRSQKHILATIHKIRSISLHPFKKEMESDEEYIGASARLKLTFEILDRVHQRAERALIFLESLELQPVIAEIVQRRYCLDNPPLLISGEVAGPKRKARVDEFQRSEGFGVMILSPRAGGVGLTLTAANHLIHLSRWWNPAVEDQCTDRIYRIGQKKIAHIYHPLAVHPALGEHSFDIRLDALLRRKRHLSRALLIPPIPSEADAQALFGETIESSSDHP